GSAGDREPAGRCGCPPRPAYRSDRRRPAERRPGPRCWTAARPGGLAAPPGARWHPRCPSGGRRRPPAPPRHCPEPDPWRGAAAWWCGRRAPAARWCRSPGVGARSAGYDIAYAIPPFSERAAARLVDAPATSVKLRGTRGLPPADREALADLVVRVGLLAEDLPETATLELYPVLVAQRGLSVVGARVRLAQAPNRTDGDRRVLAGPIHG